MTKNFIFFLHLTTTDRCLLTFTFLLFWNVNAFVYHFYFSFPGLVTVLTVSDKLVSFDICHYCFMDFQIQLNLMLFHVGATCADLFFLLNFIFTIKFKPTSVADFTWTPICADFHTQRKILGSYQKKNPPGRGRQGALSQLHSLNISHFTKIVYHEP